MGSAQFGTCNKIGIEAATAELLQRITKNDVENYEIAGLAGPNNILQILFDNMTWISVAKGFVLTAAGAGATAFMTSLGTEAGKSAWAKLSRLVEKRPEPPISEENCLKLIEIIKQAQQGNAVSFGPLKREYNYAGRYPGIEVNFENPIRLVQATVSLGLYGEQMSKKVDEFAELGNGSYIGVSQNVSSALEPLDDEKLTLAVQYLNSEKEIFDWLRYDDDANRFNRKGEK